MLKKLLVLFFAIILWQYLLFTAYAQQASGVSISSIYWGQDLVQYQTVRLYVVVTNKNDDDFAGFIGGYIKGGDKNRELQTQQLSIFASDYDGVFWDVDLDDLTDTVVHITIWEDTNKDWVLGDDEKQDIVAMQEEMITVLVDSDKDGVPNINDTDDDNDGLSDEEEAVVGTDYMDPDTDDDGIVDGQDDFPLDPNRSDIEDSASDNEDLDEGEDKNISDDISTEESVKKNNENSDAETDDNDNMSNTQSEDNSSPEDIDSDNDGISDSIEVLYGLDPNDASDTNQDLDGDGVKNIVEAKLGLELDNSNTYGISDKWIVNIYHGMQLLFILIIILILIYVYKKNKYKIKHYVGNVLHNLIYKRKR